MDLMKIQIKHLEGKENWLNWKGRVSILLRGVPKAMDIVEERLNKPSPLPAGASNTQTSAYESELTEFTKGDCNAMIIITSNMTEETYEKVRSLTSAREMWLELHRLYESPNEDKAYDLCMKLFNFKMATGDDMMTHITKLKNIWRELKIELEKKENSDLLFTVCAKLLGLCQMSIFHFLLVGEC